MKNLAQVVEKQQEEAIIIGKATTREERDEIFRLRYSVYAEEIPYNLVNVDHKNRLLYDELDKKAIILYAKMGSKIIGTGRINVGRLSDFPSDLVQTYRMDKFKKFYDAQDEPYFAVVSKGMILPEYRSTPAMYQIMAKLYDLYCDYGVQFAFVNCNFHLIPFYEHYGSRRIDKNIVDPNIGAMASLVMLVDDVKHLRAVGSPLFRKARKRVGLNNNVVDWFKKEFSFEIETAIHSRFTSEEELWNIIYQYLGNMPNQVIHLLKELSTEEAKLFLHSCSSIVHCHAGDCIAVGDNASQELSILLSGKVQSATGENIKPGQQFGENGIDKRAIHSKSYIATEDTTILVLSYFLFNNFRRRHPDIARKILYSMQKQNYYLYTQNHKIIG